MTWTSLLREQKLKKLIEDMLLDQEDMGTVGKSLYRTRFEEIYKNTENEYVSTKLDIINSIQILLKYVNKSLEIDEFIEKMVKKYQISNENLKKTTF